MGVQRLMRSLAAALAFATLGAGLLAAFGTSFAAAFVASLATSLAAAVLMLAGTFGVELAAFTMRLALDAVTVAGTFVTAGIEMACRHGCGRTGACRAPCRRGASFWRSR